QCKRLGLSALKCSISTELGLRAHRGLHPRPFCVVTRRHGVAEGHHVQMDGFDRCSVIKAQPGRYDRTKVTALRAVAFVTETLGHQLVPQSCGTSLPHWPGWFR